MNKPRRLGCESWVAQDRQAIALLEKANCFIDGTCAWVFTDANPGAVLDLRRSIH